MLSLASLKYREVSARRGGPIAAIEAGPFPVRGRQMVLANATLREGLTPKSRLALFSDADGTGTHSVASIARHKAISEALERWAFHATVRSDRAEEFGFHQDPSTTGMAAFPGWSRRQARRCAVLEAVERFSIMSWWEGRAVARLFDTDWPGVSAAVIDGPFGGLAVIAFARTSWGGYVYGHAADETFSAACERAVIELARHEWILRRFWLESAVGEPPAVSNTFERRCIFFATEQGHDLFRQRVAKCNCSPALRPELLCDAPIPGPWDKFATVWRFGLRPPSDGYIRGGDEYFFL